MTVADLAVRESPNVNAVESTSQEDSRLMKSGERGPFLRARRVELRINLREELPGEKGCDGSNEIGGKKYGENWGQNQDRKLERLLPAVKGILDEIVPESRLKIPPDATRRGDPENG